MRIEPNTASAGEAVPDDGCLDVETVIALYRNDTRAALAASFEEIAHLQSQIQLAVGATSRGYTRGWRR